MRLDHLLSDAEDFMFRDVISTLELASSESKDPRVIELLVKARVLWASVQTVRQALGGSAK